MLASEHSMWSKVAGSCLGICMMSVLGMLVNGAHGLQVRMSHFLRAIKINVFPYSLVYDVCKLIAHLVYPGGQ